MPGKLCEPGVRTSMIDGWRVGMASESELAQRESRDARPDSEAVGLFLRCSMELVNFKL